MSASAGDSIVLPSLSPTPPLASLTVRPKKTGGNVLGFWGIYPNDSTGRESSPQSSRGYRGVCHSCSGGLARGSVKVSQEGEGDGG